MRVALLSLGESHSFSHVHRTYKAGDGNLQDTDSFSGTQLLRLTRLANQAYDRISSSGISNFTVYMAPASSLGEWTIIIRLRLGPK